MNGPQSIYRLCVRRASQCKSCISDLSQVKLSLAISTAEDLRINVSQSSLSWLAWACARQIGGTYLHCTACSMLSLKNIQLLHNKTLITIHCRKNLSFFLFLPPGVGEIFNSLRKIVPPPPCHHPQGSGRAVAVSACMLILSPWQHPTLG